MTGHGFAESTVEDASLCDTLLRNLISGELRVGSVRGITEEVS